jgi:hypothetical protein
MYTQQSKKFTNKQGVSIVTNYKDAVGWLHNDYVMCNNIASLDASIYDNLRFNLLDEDHCAREIFQWFLTSASESDVQYLENRFGLLFTYSDLLDVYVLCVDHYGTSWDYVSCSDSEMDAFATKQIKKAVK